MEMSIKRWKQLSLLTFRKWGRKNFSLFATMHKVVKISVLSVAYFLSVPALTVAMDNDTTVVKREYNLEEIEVSASRAPSLFSEIVRVLTVIDSKNIEQGAATSLQDVLGQVAALDVRQRGAGGVQADISIRGGTFDQVLILLNGINITDPQTGHHNLNLPVSLSQIERIEILEGPAARIYGPNAFSGAINIITKQFEEKTITARFDGGSFGYFGANIAAGFNTGIINHLIAGNRERSDGHIENTDFGISNLFYSGQLLSEAGRLSAQAGATEKSFGANSFYTPLYPNQFEQVQSLFSAVKWESFSKLHLTPVLYWRRHFDKFLLFRNDPGLYKNLHRTDVWGANLNSWFLWKGGKTAFGAEFRSEKILSNALGDNLDKPVKVPREDEFYSKSKTRTTASVFFEHSYYLNNWTFSAGSLANQISDGSPGWNIFPGLDVSYQYSPALKFVVSWNSSLRMPTFTDLYYSDPVQKGNPQLKPEKLTAIEGGIKFKREFFRGQWVVFAQNGKDIIDWVRNENEEMWQSRNLARINSLGSEIEFIYQMKEHLNRNWPNRLSLSYFYNSQEKTTENLISRYVLDNLKHKLVATLNQTVLNNISVDLKLSFQDREGSYTRYENTVLAGETPFNPFFLTDVKIQYTHRYFRFYMSANNLFNQNYYDLGNVAQPGRWLKTGISFTLPVK